MRPKKKGADAPTQAFPVTGATPCKRTSFRHSLKANARAVPGSAASGGGFDLRINRFLSAFAASLIAFLPAHAFAQDQAAREDTVSVRDRDRPEYEPQGARLGAFVLNARLDVDVASTDNLFASEDSTAQDDIYLQATPTVVLESDWSRNALALEAGGALRSHLDFDNEDFTTYYLRGTGRVDIGDSTSLYGAARAAHQVTPRTDPDSPTIGSPVEYDRMDLSAGVEQRFARFRIRADAGVNEYDYDAAQNARDNEESFLRGSLTVDLTPRVGLLVRASHDERDYKNAPQFDSEGQSYLGGVMLNTDLMRGELTAGAFEREYDNGDSFDGLAVAAELEWYITPLTTLTFDARRDADDQLGVNSGLPYVTEYYGARVDHELLRNVILTAGVRLGEYDYDTVDRHDDYTEANIGADYLLNRRVALSARYEYDEVESSGVLAYRDYEVNKVTLGVSLRL